LSSRPRPRAILPPEKKRPAQRGPFGRERCRRRR
jgi:hypothetical protein